MDPISKIHILRQKISRLDREIFAVLMMSKEEALKVLGLDVASTLDDVKRAYRKQVLFYHPDRLVGASPEENDRATEKLKEINEAREVLEFGGTKTMPQERSAPRSEEFWESNRKKWGPKPSQHYTEADISNLVDKIFEQNFLQSVVRQPISYLPMDVILIKEWGSYNRPLGPKQSTKRLKPEQKEALLSRLKSQSGKIFDIGIRKREMWITWEVSNGDYFSISFEPVKAPVKKDPNVGMSQGVVEQYFRSKGLVNVAGGTKYTYFAPPGTPKKGDSRYIRLGKGNMSIVLRSMDPDIKVSKEIYYGAATPAILDAMIRMVTRKS